MKQKQKVLLAMSGGVDSSVAALILKKQGYQVIGAFMKNWSDTKNSFGECSWKDDRKVAIQIATQLEIPLITLDFEKQYKKDVVGPMFNSYKKGITPNPDVDCNQKLKFPLLWKAAKKLGANFIATGHYARIKKIDIRKNVNIVKSTPVKLKLSMGKRGDKYQYQMLRAKDESKDQSYFLYRLSEKDLEHSLFPIGELTKKQVREIAKKNKFLNYNRKSTVGICFIGKLNLKKFLQKKIKPKKGNILSPEGKIIGQHDGIYYYTIGQRIGPRFGIEVDKGLGVIKRWYVASKNLKKNEIIAAPEGNELNFRKEIFLKNPHWINKKPKTGKVLSRIRQVGELLTSKLFYDKKNGYRVILNKAITGVSEGQAVVLYQGTKVLGGGVISFKN
jgi:tRNA-specific 2-thiouridylase